MGNAVQNLDYLTADSLKSMPSEEFAVAKEKAAIGKERETKAKAEQAGRTEAEFYKAYGPALTQPYERFSPTQETASGFAALGTLMMVAGGMLGSSGKLSGIGAMNNIAGMMEGYRTGRKDLYEQERQMFEENMKVQEKNRALIKEAFDQALKVAKYDLTGAKNMLEQRLTSLGAVIPAKMVKQSGVVPAAAAMDQMHTNYKNITGSIAQKMSQTDLIRIEEARRKAAEETEKKQISAIKDAEYGILEGKTGTFSPKEIYDAKTLRGATFQPLAKPTTATDAISKVGLGIGDVLDQQTSEAKAAAESFIRRYGVESLDQKLIPTEVNAIKQADRTAENVAKNRDAVGVLATVVGKLGESSASIIDNVRNIFSSSSPTKEQDAAVLLNQKSNQVDKALDDYANANPTQADQVRRAKIIGKELFSLALADAVAVGRPTVFLERSLSSFYSPNVRPETLIEIIKTRAVDGNERLPKVFRNDTWQKPAKLLQTKSAEDFIDVVTGQQKISSETETAKPVPTDADRAYVRAHPEVRDKFIAKFGVEP